MASLREHGSRSARRWHFIILAEVMPPNRRWDLVEKGIIQIEIYPPRGLEFACCEWCTCGRLVHRRWVADTSWITLALTWDIASNWAVELMAQHIQSVKETAKTKRPTCFVWFCTRKMEFCISLLNSLSHPTNSYPTTEALGTEVVLKLLEPLLHMHLGVIW